MIAWFILSVVLMLSRSSAVSNGFEGVQRKLGELNQKMQPINFAMRTDVHTQTYYSHTEGPGDVGVGVGGMHRRTRIIYRYFLEISNTTQPVQAVQGVVIGVAGP